MPEMYNCSGCGREIDGSKEGVFKQRFHNDDLTFCRVCNKAFPKFTKVAEPIYENSAIKRKAELKQAMKDVFMSASEAREADNNQRVIRIDDVPVRNPSQAIARQPAPVVEASPVVAQGQVDDMPVFVNEAPAGYKEAKKRAGK